MTYISFEKYGPEYQKLWDTMHIIRDNSELQRVSDKIKKYKDVYQKVEAVTGVPWQMIGVIHERESGEQDIGVFKTALHNGERIIGTNRKTRLVPAGRGPFADWQSAAVDALVYQGFNKIKDWTPARMLWALEPYNGYGYRNKGLRSPYLWASTNWQQPGKYVKDGVFDPSVMDTQIGCAALLKYLGIGANNLTPVARPVIIGGGAAAAAHTWPQFMPYIIGIAAILIIADIGYQIYKRNKNV